MPRTAFVLFVTISTFAVALVGISTAPGCSARQLDEFEQRASQLGGGLSEASDNTSGVTSVVLGVAGGVSTIAAGVAGLFAKSPSQRKIAAGLKAIQEDTGVLKGVDFEDPEVAAAIDSVAGGAAKAIQKAVGVD